MPTLDRSTEISAPLRNTDLPSALDLPEGCFFRDRCPVAVAGCERPQVLAPPLGDGDRFARCHRARQVLAGEI